MSEYIVDASVVIQRFIRDTHTEYAKALFRQLTSEDILHVPEHCLIECANVLWKHVRFHGMTEPDAEILIEDLAGLPLHIVPVTGLLKSALQIGLEHQLAIYDAMYIALAQRLHYPLVTVDIRQETVAKEVGVTIKSVIDFIL
jgi:predicted nucleic acid-binding protein